MIACLIFILFTFNTSYGQGYECDNNFEDCGTPEQSGGGGGKGGGKGGRGGRGRGASGGGK